MFVEAGFRFARFKDLAGKDVYTNSTGANTTTVGTLDFWGQLAADGNTYPQLYVADGLPAGEGIVDARPAVVNLSGAAIRAGVRYRF